MSPSTESGGTRATGARFDLTGKKALVTGGSRGLGRAMAEAFAVAGADVMIASRKQDSCDAAAAEIAAVAGRPVVGVAAHVGRWEDCDRLIEAAYSRLGRVDVLVDNAGMSPLDPTLPDVSEDLWDKVLGVNLKGPFRLAAVIGARMAEGAGGSIMEAFEERARTEIPLGRGGQADEIVGAALYLASDASSFTTGAVIKVDGGSALTPG